MVGSLLKVNEIRATLDKKKNHDVGPVIGVLPFTANTIKSARSKKIAFNSVLGELVRKICGYKFEEKKPKDELDIVFSNNPFIEQIINEVECSDDAAYDLKRFLEQYLFFEGEEIKPIHPFLFNYVPSTFKENERFAQFIKDILVNENEKIIGVFNNKQSDNILTELILNKVHSLKEDKKTLTYQNLLPNFTKLYEEDLLFISQYDDYFLQTFSLLTHYYTFMYICQMLLKFEGFTSANYDIVQPLYFALEWESISKRRKAADEFEGFKFIKENSANLFTHIHTQSQLSWTWDNSEVVNGKITFLNYNQLSERYKNNMDYLNDVKKWITSYCEWKKFEVKVDLSQINDLDNAFRTLFKHIKDGMNADVRINFGKVFELVGGKTFLKNRGSLGQVLNMNHEMLLLLTAVSVKDKRIPLHQLFKEYEKRGIAFDRYSKKEIVDLLDSLNIIDKKSDSGDAQYVKPIL